MARTADHDVRKRELGDAVQALIGEVGFDRVTVARVAARAGYSVGLVQHYFASKDELLLHTYHQMTRGWRARVDQQIADGNRRQQPIRTVLRDACLQTLPLDPPRRAEYRISQAFLGRALDNPALAKVAAAAAAALRTEVTAVIDNGKECGEVARSTDSGRAALRLLAILDGLAPRLYHEPAALVAGAPMPEVVSEVLSEAIGEVFTGRCHHYR